MQRLSLFCIILLLGGFFGSPIAVADDKGFYIGGQGGVNFATGGTFQGSGASPDFRTSYATGWAAGAFVGYNFGHLSTEFEFAHQANNIDGINVLVDGGLGAALNQAGPISGVLSPVTGKALSNSSFTSIPANAAGTIPK